MERKEFNIQGTVNTTPALVPMGLSVDVSNMDFGSPLAGQSSVVVSRVMTITGNAGVVAIRIGGTDWVALDKTMAGSVTEVSVGSSVYQPVDVAQEVLLGEFAEGEYILNFKVTPPNDIDLNTYTQNIVVIGE